MQNLCRKRREDDGKRFISETPTDHIPGSTEAETLPFTDVLAGNHSNGLASDLMSRKADSIPLTATERRDYL